MTPGIGTSTTQCYPSALALGGSHGDDVGQYSTVEGTKKPLGGGGGTARGAQTPGGEILPEFTAALPALEPVQAAT